MDRSVLSRAESDASRLSFDWGSILWLANPQIGNTQQVTLGRTVIEPGCENPRHCHSRTDEVLYLLQGRLTHTLGSDSVTLEAGDTICIPAGVFHNAINTGNEDADMIVAFTGERDFILETE